MTPKRYCALALPLFPLALLATGFVTPTDSTDNAEQLGAAASHGAAWAGAALLELLAAALLPFAAVAVAQAIRGRGERVAAAGVVLAFLGTLGMTSIALRHVYVYGLATADRAAALHAFDRIDGVFGLPVFLLMLCAPLSLIVLASAAARARIAPRLVAAGAVLFFVIDMLPVPAAEELQGIVGVVTFAVLARSLLRGAETPEPKVRHAAAPARA